MRNTEDRESSDKSENQFASIEKKSVTRRIENPQLRPRINLFL